VLSKPRGQTNDGRSALKHEAKLLETQQPCVALEVQLSRNPGSNISSPTPGQDVLSVASAMTSKQRDVLFLVLMYELEEL
jgi:hypothetical protein